MEGSQPTARLASCLPVAAGACVILTKGETQKIAQASATDALGIILGSCALAGDPAVAGVCVVIGAGEPLAIQGAARAATKVNSCLAIAATPAPLPFPQPC